MHNYHRTIINYVIIIWVVFYVDVYCIVHYRIFAPWALQRNLVKLLLKKMNIESTQDLCNWKQLSIEASCSFSIGGSIEELFFLS
jgi:hypothetical protein